jgi:hypothetical protein
MNNFLSKLVDKQSINFITAEQSELEQEIVNFESHQYINTNDDDEIESSLMFFKHNANSYPLLINVAKNIFCIPIASVAVESIFSQSGITANDLRSSLSAKNLKACVLYKTNKRYFFKIIFISFRKLKSVKFS